ncbi:MAG: LysR family transcriptional regulator [Roseibium sp.]|uniref:LysR family transcriptional regulator n=1 Tax=Roseibium sp. TaxID=1936156 RepID=UPI002638CCB8|nr:LysR family transcriptional regulator [Roseibium sp.]MCV0424952.1 LysR family transcriptional regulator [Roseibium sp.]
MRNLDAIAVFVEVVRQGSFTAASRALRMPLSTVSRKVAELEKELQILLLDRSRKPLRATEAGSTYFDLCSKGINALNFANQAVRSQREGLSGTLRITVPPNLTELLFAQPIDRFLRQQPEARVQVLVSERMLDFVDDGVDLSFRVARPSAPNLVIRKLLQHRHRLCAAPSYLAVNPLPVRPEDLNNHSRLGFGFQAQEKITWHLTKDDEAYTAPFEPTLAINDYLALKTSIEIGTGIGELPGLLCRKELGNGQLVEVLPDWQLPEISLYAVYAGKTGLSKLARAFLDEVSSFLAPF